MDLRNRVWSMCAAVGLVLIVGERKWTSQSASRTSGKSAVWTRLVLKQSRAVIKPGRFLASTAGTTVWDTPDAGLWVSSRVQAPPRSRRSPQSNPLTHSRRSVPAQVLAWSASCPRITGTESTNPSRSRQTRADWAACWPGAPPVCPPRATRPCSLCSLVNISRVAFCVELHCEKNTESERRIHAKWTCFVSLDTFSVANVKVALSELRFYKEKKKCFT